LARTQRAASIDVVHETCGYEHLREERVGIEAMGARRLSSCSGENGSYEWSWSCASDRDAEGDEAASKKDRLARQKSRRNARGLRINEISPSRWARSISEGMGVHDGCSVPTRRRRRHRSAELPVQTKRWGNYRAVTLVTPAGDRARLRSGAHRLSMRTPEQKDECAIVKRWNFIEAQKKAHELP
jgi:hypothetical protein